MSSDAPGRRPSRGIALPAIVWVPAMLAFFGLLGFVCADSIRAAFELHTTRQLIEDRRGDLLAECLELATDEAASTLCLRRYADDG